MGNPALLILALAKKDQTDHPGSYQRDGLNGGILAIKKGQTANVMARIQADAKLNWVYNEQSRTWSKTGEQNLYSPAKMQTALANVQRLQAPLPTRKPKVPNLPPLLKAQTGSINSQPIISKLREIETMIKKL